MPLLLKFYFNTVVCGSHRIAKCNAKGCIVQTRVRQQSEARAGPVLHSGTVPQRGGIPVNVREALNYILRDKTQLYRKAYNGFFGTGRLSEAARKRDTAAGRQSAAYQFFQSERRPKAGVSRKNGGLCCAGGRTLLRRLPLVSSRRTCSRRSAAFCTPPPVRPLYRRGLSQVGGPVPSTPDRT